MKMSNWPNILPRKGNLRLTKVESSLPWFEIRKVNDDTYAILEPNHCEEVISYLIVGKERAVLFDSGMGIANIRTETRRITLLPLIVINSHCHYDHIGGNIHFSNCYCVVLVLRGLRLKQAFCDGRFFKIIYQYIKRSEQWK